MNGSTLEMMLKIYSHNYYSSQLLDSNVMKLFIKGNLFFDRNKSQSHLLQIRPPYQEIFYRVVWILQHHLFD